jgi:DHA2 family multidrug resistance protein-like MFS transporter
MQAPARSDLPDGAGLVLTTLILVAAVANLPLAVGNVALPDIGLHFNASQTQLNLVAVCYSLGLAVSVLWFGAVGDRYGRKQMMLLGVLVAVAASMVAAWAPTIEILIGARFVGGLGAGMAYPTTLSLITALWGPGPGRTKSIALWSAIGGAISVLGAVIAGLLLSFAWWGSVFLCPLPLAVVAVPLAVKLIPSHVSETTDPVDHLGGMLSLLLVGGVILSINFATVPNSGTLVLSLAIIAVAALVGFALRERSATNPLYDLHIAGRRVFWVAACSGIIVFGSLMGAAFIGEQYVQNVLGYSTVDAGLAILPAAVAMVLIAPRSAKLVGSHGSRLALLAGDASIFLAFLIMLLLWKQGASYWVVGLGFALLGAGVGFAGTPASNSLTGSVPVTRVGMASGTADLQRDLGGAIMQSIMGALLTAGYAAAAAAAIGSSPNAAQVTNNVQSELTKSFNGAEEIAKQYPQYSKQIVASAKQAFVHGDHWAFASGAIAVALGAILVFFCFPKFEKEKSLLADYRRVDSARDTQPAP